MVKGTDLRAERWDKVGRVRTVPGRGTVGGRGRGEAQGGRGAQGTGEVGAARSSRQGTREGGYMGALVYQG